MEKETVMLIGADMITIDYDNKSAVKMHNPMAYLLADPDRDWQKTGEKMLIKMGYKIVGNETIQGKNCAVWQHGKQKLWLWKGITLKSVEKVGGKKTIETAVDVKTNVEIPASAFEVPEGYELENLLTPLILDENITDVERENYQSGGRTWESIQMEIPDVALILEDDRSFGPVTLSISQDQGVYSLEQTIDLAESNISIPGVNLLDLTGAGYTVKLSTPQIIDTNGILEEAGTSVWEVSVSELVQEAETVYLQADYVLEPYEGTFIPWETFFPYVVIGFLVAGFLALLIVIIVNTRGKREKKREVHF